MHFYLWYVVSHKSHSTALWLIALCALLLRITSCRSLIRKKSLLIQGRHEQTNINKNCKFILFQKSFQRERERKVKQCVKIPFEQNPSTRRPQKCNQPHEILYHREEKRKDNRKFISTSMIIRMEWTNQQAYEMCRKNRGENFITQDLICFSWAEKCHAGRSGGMRTIDGLVNEANFNADFMLKVSIVILLIMNYCEKLLWLKPHVNGA